MTLNHQDDAYGPLYYSSIDVTAQMSTIPLSDLPITWQIKMTGTAGNLSEMEIKDVILVLRYEWD